MTRPSLLLTAVASLALPALVWAQTAVAKSCLFLASYHSGYEWQDGIERGVRETLKGHCKLDTYYLDTKRNLGSEFAKASAIKAKAYIESTKPDIVIASDDNVSRYLIAPYFKDADTPFVFCGVNWSVERYGFPYSNVTGMVEVNSIEPLLKIIQTVNPEATRGLFLAGDVPSTRSNYERYRKVFGNQGIAVEDGMVNGFDAWKKSVGTLSADYDFVIVANKAGIDNWNREAAYALLLEHAGPFTVGHHEFMVDFNMFSMTKIPEEQGEWAASLAIEILNGGKISDYPIVANRRWNIYINEQLLEKAGHELPANILRKAVKVGQDQ